jgi:hypothetical protein
MRKNNTPDLWDTAAVEYTTERTTPRNPRKARKPVKPADNETVKDWRDAPADSVGE